MYDDSWKIVEHESVWLDLIHCNLDGLVERHTWKPARLSPTALTERHRDVAD